MLSASLARGIRQASKPTALQSRSATTASSSQKFKVLVVGGGSAGLSVAQQIYNRFQAAGKSLAAGDIGIVDAAENHYYQPGWTLVGSGLLPKTDFSRPLASLIPAHIAHIPENVKSFSPNSSTVTTTSGRDISYDTLVVAAGLQTNFDGIAGLPAALEDPNSGVSTIYSYKTCDKVWTDIENLKSGKAVFTQPAGIIKCAGAPQKIMWMAWDRFRRTGRQDISVNFYTGMPTMFSVKKYSDALDALRQERGVGGYFGHNLVSIDSGNRKATFKKADDGSEVTVDYSLLHVTPPMGPLNVFKGSPIADAAGWVPVNKATLQHDKPEFSNVFAIGDCSNLPTSKTAAAITAQAPVLTENLFSFVDTGKVAIAEYDGYTSCPLLTGYGELMLAEFKYGLETKESFSDFFDQKKSNRFFYHLKKDVFPYAYWNYMVKGTWFGSKGLSKPEF
ncbi:Sulfide:quinone oxidoreductase, mitochondrial [Psilocybe cubensis]|uniref:Sulfide:quinone oxidoreductase, mitochondrial n=2 Tax=Psilocybe cubensis TaxID=181762 RepID=A0A8H7Y1D4_PSICU|nr:Sulfide:quinone oxidoreductase, mitochondrial [Psilocybe cubensis]KAH9484298.1 Sulfide:quinone oxidoreductase, mitochondrial [Psilocybe cubensis]